MESPSDPFTDWPPPATLDLETTYRELSRLLAWEEEANLWVPASPPPSHESLHSQNTTGTSGNSSSSPQAPDEGYFVESRRLALRTRAMELSRGRIRQLSILSVPPELLHDIFHFTFRYDHLPQYGAKCRDQIRNSACQIRLTCRTFDQFTSPYLIHENTLTVKLTQDSLDRLECFARNNHISKAIRKVILVLDYRPENLATDISAFSTFMLDLLRAKDIYCRDQMGTFLESPGDEHLPCAAAIVNFEHMQMAWGLGPTDRRYYLSRCDEYRKTLLDAHAEYRVEHRKQMELITTGSFVNTVSSAIARLPNFRELIFSTSDRYMYGKGEDSGTLEPLLDNQELFKFLTRPLTWPENEKACATNLPPARILTELPIALHSAGVSKYHLYINCFPNRSSMSSIWPPQPSSHNPPMSNTINEAILRAACRNLTGFWFVPFDDIYLEHEDGDPLDKEQLWLYLSCAIANPNLELLGLDMSAYVLESLDRDRSCNIGSFLDSIECSFPRLKVFALMSISLNPGQLERFCHLIGDKLEFVTLSYLHLDGSWAGVVDAMRGRFLTGNNSRRRSIYLETLYGDDLHGKDITNDSNWDSYSGPYLDSTSANKWRKGKILEAYIMDTNETAKNPLRSE